MGTYVPVRAPTGPGGPHESLVPVRLRVYVPVPYKNRDQCPRSLAHNHCLRFVARTGTKGCPLVPFLPQTRTKDLAIYIPCRRAEHSTGAQFFRGGQGEGFVVL